MWITAFSVPIHLSGTDVEAGGFANIEFNPYSSVEGCLYLITPAELSILDKYVGYPEVGYSIHNYINCHLRDNWHFKFWDQLFQISVS
jgi:hypothetical protein